MPLTQFYLTIMELFYTTDIDFPYLYLQHEEAIHCIKSLRKNIGDYIHITDGLGNHYYGIITQIERKKDIVTVHAQKQQNFNKSQNLGLCIAPTKNIDRMEWLIEKAVELGVSQIQWIITERSQRKTIPLERMQRIAISAMKQSLQYFLPNFYPIINFSSWLEQQKILQGVIGYCGEDIDKKPLNTLQITNKQNTYWICIGPEGDFTQNEVKQSLNTGLIPVSIGTHRLRTETAALTAISYFYL